MLRGQLQPTYSLDVLGMSLKSSFATTPCHFKKLEFPFGKTSRWKFLDVELARFAVRIATPIENNRFTAAELGKGVFYFINTSTQTVVPIFVEHWGG